MYEHTFHRVHLVSTSPESGFNVPYKLQTSWAYDAQARQELYADFERFAAEAIYQLIGDDVTRISRGEQTMLDNDMPAVKLKAVAANKA